MILYTEKNENNNIQSTNKDMFDMFVQDLENIYHKNSIYRAIVVTDLKKEEWYAKQLEQYNHSVFIAHTITNQDYDTIDNRVLLMNYDIFDKFLDYIYSNILSSSYNLISIYI